MQPLEFRSKQCIHTTDTKMSPEITNPQILHSKVQQELLLQTKFIKKYFQSLIVQRTINDSSNDDTRYHNETRT
jgi:hypothetical protein